MTTTSRVNNVTTPSREFRLDELSLCRLNWLQSFWNAHEWKPSGSVVVRRALAFYLDHIESLMTEEEGTFSLRCEESLQSELVKIKAHRNNESAPFGERKRFDGRTFSEMLKKARAAKRAEDYYRFPKHGLSSQQSEEWDRIWEKLDRGEKQ